MAIFARVFLWPAKSCLEPPAKNATFGSVFLAKKATFGSIGEEKIATFRSFRGSAEHLQHDGEEHECAQDAAEAGGEEDEEGVEYAVAEPALEG